MDCDEDGINDCLCTDTRGRMWTMLSSKGFKNDGGGGDEGTAQCKAQGKSASKDLKSSKDIKSLDIKSLDIKSLDKDTLVNLVLNLVIN